MPAIVRDSALDLFDRLIDELLGARAVTAFVRRRAIEIGLRGAQVAERRLHLRLGRAEMSGDEAIAPS